jgi:hypothetical protein
MIRAGRLLHAYLFLPGKQTESKPKPGYCACGLVLLFVSNFLWCLGTWALKRSPLMTAADTQRCLARPLRMTGNSPVEAMS